ncbi:MAG: GNAT family N-acetyltransferase, partial [Paracoccus sp. (in: a-proteobacteria)]|nr:GNAT family N-acetyltransferase [Paracoccus sp. (in: a-proteobacteria)]
ITFWPTERSEAEIAGMIAARHAEGHAFLVAETAARITGFASYGQFRGGAGYTHSLEHTIHVAPAARGTGTGRALIVTLMKHARAGGGRIMVGAVTASNTGSLAFHRRCGFAEWGRIPAAGWKFGRFHDLILMGRDLLGDLAG